MKVGFTLTEIHNMPYHRQRVFLEAIHYLEALEGVRQVEAIAVAIGGDKNGIVKGWFARLFGTEKAKPRQKGLSLSDMFALAKNGTT